MKYDEFAFFNQQLALMLRDGIPLEGALRRLCQDMRAGALRNELAALEGDLAHGTPLAAALESRQLPELYKRMMLVGMKSGDLPGALTMLADYFQRQSNIWTRLKSLLVYPLIVMFVAFLISAVLSVIWSRFIGPTMGGIYSGMEYNLPGGTVFALTLLKGIWVFPALFGLFFFAILGAVIIPALRTRLFWRLPAFREASVSRVAASLNLLLKNGVSFPDALALVEGLENNLKAATDIGAWRTNLAAGFTKFSEVASTNKMFPPMFVWVVANAGENVAAGFERAAEIYQARAHYRTEVALYSFMPLAALFLGVIVLSQAFLVISMFLPFIVWLG